TLESGLANLAGKVRAGGLMHAATDHETLFVIKAVKDGIRLLFGLIHLRTQSETVANHQHFFWRNGTRGDWRIILLGKNTNGQAQHKGDRQFSDTHNAVPPVTIRSPELLLPVSISRICLP